MTIIVLGRDGFVGSNLINSLRQITLEEVVGIGKENISDFEKIFKSNDDDRTIFVNCATSIFRSKDLISEIENQEYIFKKSSKYKGFHFFFGSLDIFKCSYNITCESPLVDFHEASLYQKVKLINRDFYKKFESIGLAGRSCYLIHPSTLTGLNPPTKMFKSLLASMWNENYQWDELPEHKIRDYLQIEDLAKFLLKLRDKGHAFGLKEYCVGSGVPCCSLAEIEQQFEALPERLWPVMPFQTCCGQPHRCSRSLPCRVVAKSGVITSG